VGKAFVPPPNYRPQFNTKEATSGKNYQLLPQELMHPSRLQLPTQTLVAHPLPRPPQDLLHKQLLLLVLSLLPKAVLLTP
jgi:hypothetical protein